MNAKMKALSNVASTCWRDCEGWIGRLEGFEQAPQSALRELREKVAAQSFDLVIAGQFKRGKSSVINALLGADLLPVGVVPLTSVITVLAFAETASAQVIFENDERRIVPMESVAEYATERHNPNNAKGVAQVRIGYPAEWLRSGIRLIDTPGVGSIYRHNTDVAWAFLPKADAVLLVLSVEQPLSSEERNFLEFISGHTGKTFFLLNKADLLDAGELHEAVEFTQQALAEAVGSAVALFPVSARLALAKDDDGSIPTRSGFPDLRRALDDFLLRERGTVLQESIVRQLLRMLAQTRTKIELEQKSLTTPLDELRRKIELFEAKKAQVKVARDDSAVLLGKEAVRIWMEQLDTELASFRADLRKQVEASVIDKIGENSALSTRQLASLLERMTVDEIRAGYDGWRSEQDQRLAHKFTAWCARHARQIDDSVDELFRFSSELFQIAYAAERVEAAWSVKSGFYYKFWSEPPSLRQIATSLMLYLPRGLGHRLLRRRFVEFARESIDTQSGRTRYDFLQRLEASARDFRRELMTRIDAAIDGIETAIRKGTTLREVGTQASDERIAMLNLQLESLNQIEAEIRENHSGNTATQG